MDSDKIREVFARELEGASEAKTALVTKLAEQGTRLIEHRKKIMETVITVSAGFIAVPILFKEINIINQDLYQIGLSILIFNIIFTLLHLKESVDTDEVRTVSTIGKLLGIIERRIHKLNEYLIQGTFSSADVTQYREFRKGEDYSDDMINQQESNKKELENISKNKINYPSSLIMLLFTSGVFFVIVSIIYPKIELTTIVLAEIIFVVITSNNFAGKIISLYSKAINIFKI